jgi:hypothetical protein
MAATQRFVGAQTPFGTITQVSNSVYNALATVQAKDGSTGTYRLPFLIALGVTLAGKVTA